MNAGAPGGSRTPNPQIRSLMLYPIELRVHELEESMEQKKRAKCAGIRASKTESLRRVALTGIEPVFEP
jgi:hypothetical protein